MDIRAERLARIRTDAAHLGVDALLLTAAADVRYTCGFAGAGDPREVEVLLVGDAQYAIVDGRNVTSVMDACPGFTVIDFAEHGSRDAAIAALATKHRAQRIGIDISACTIEDERGIVSALRDMGGSTCIAVHSPVSGTTRIVKDDGEIEHLQDAATIADLGAAWLTTHLRPGMEERDAAWGLERAMRDAGADALAFETIIAAGPNSAKPHHHTSTRVLATGDAVVCDFGAMVHGYRSDITRTFFLGTPTREQSAAYTAVFAAHGFAAAQLGAGKTGQEIDAIARTYLIASGYPDIPHSVGHGIGLETHERPWLSHRAAGANVLPEGSAVTIEPGVYLAGKFGIRIEDDYVVCVGHRIALTRAPATLDAIIIALY